MAEDLILVVDDDPAVLQAAAAMLTQSGYRVLVASDAAMAFKLFETKPGIALLITDVVMPGLDGLMLADMVKLRHPEARIVYTTGNPAVAERQPGLRYGPTVDKPIRAAQLETLVRDVLARPAAPFGFRPDCPSA
ncbi:MAG: response regulator [Pseudomonadota bacterium]